MIVYNIISTSILACWIIIHIYYGFISNSKIRSLIIETLEISESQLDNVVIRKFRFKELFRYKAFENISLILSFGIFKLLTKPGVRVFRVVEIEKTNEEMNIKYLEMNIRKRKVISHRILEEFDL